MIACANIQDASASEGKHAIWTIFYHGHERGTRPELAHRSVGKTARRAQSQGKHEERIRSYNDESGVIWRTNLSTTVSSG